jgi:hypothetical protein
MKTGGWIFMLGSWLAILALAGFCFYQVFHKKENR